MTSEAIEHLERGLERRLSHEQFIGRNKLENIPMPSTQTTYKFIRKERIITDSSQKFAPPKPSAQTPTPDNPILWYNTKKPRHRRALT